MRACICKEGCLAMQERNEHMNLTGFKEHFSLDIKRNERSQTNYRSYIYGNYSVSNNVYIGTSEAD